MPVSVKNAPASIGSGIKDGAITSKSAIGCDLIGCGEECSGNRRRHLCQACGVFGMNCWNDQNMGWGLRI
jgi:hypothetical protein